MNQEEKKYLISLAKISEIGPIRYQKIIKHFQKLENFWLANLKEIISAGIDFKTAEKIIEKRKKIDPNAEIQKTEKLKIKILEINESNYPRLLKEIPHPPYMIQILGDLDLEKDFPLAIVGTRKPSAYGKQVTAQLSEQLAQSGLTIVSGLALGVDALAHQGAVSAKRKTVGVLGCGLDQIYPRTNYFLAQEILKIGGAIISEFPLGTPPYKSNFPRRNRIISGLSLGVLVIEAALKSGALITAKYALEQNREVFAVPGSIYNPNSVGPNFLIKQGAATVQNAQDILEALNLFKANDFQSACQILPESEAEKRIFEILGFEAISVDKIIRLSMLNISTVNSTLAMMEIKGLIKNLGAQNYIRAR